MIRFSSFAHVLSNFYQAEEEKRLAEATASTYRFFVGRKDVVYTFLLLRPASRSAVVLTRFEKMRTKCLPHTQKTTGRYAKLR